MEWPIYLARGVQRPIFHMCIATVFDESTEGNKMYYPPTYSADGFIHATAEPQFLIEVANHFYKTSVGDWICIKLEPSQVNVFLGRPFYLEPRVR